MESLVNELWRLHSKKVEHRYQYKTPFERRALYDVDVSFPSGGLLCHYRSYWFRKVDDDSTFKWFIAADKWYSSNW